jgi:hypothetical protein
VESNGPPKSVFTHCGPDATNPGFAGRPPVCCFEKTGHASSETVVLAPIHPTHADVIAAARHAFGEAVFTREATSKMQGNRDLAEMLGASYVPVFEVKEVLCTSTATLASELTLEQRQILVQLRDISTEITAGGTEWQKPYDVVISALGWTYDHTIFDNRSITIEMVSPPEPGGQPTYPKLNSEFESSSAKHLFVVGAAAHGRDRYRYQASGGFIHGFRFNARSLWRILEERYEKPQMASSPDSRLTSHSTPVEMDGTTQYKWPAKFPAPKNSADKLRLDHLQPAWKHLLNRMNTAAGPYEMTGGSLADTLVYDCDNESVWYSEDVTEDLIHERYKDRPRLTWSFYFGVSFHLALACLLPCSLLQRYHQSNIQLIRSCSIIDVLTKLAAGADNGVEAVMCALRTESFGVFSQFIHPVLQYYAPGVVPSEKGLPSGILGDPNARGPSGLRLHPSTYWPEAQKGVSRLHIKDAWITLDWTDTGAFPSLLNSPPAPVYSLLTDIPLYV